MTLASLNFLKPCLLRAAEQAALASYFLAGKGDEKKADQAAVDAMRRELTKLPAEGEVVIGEGERDQAPMLYIGEKLGQGNIKVDIALDPLEGTTLCANMLAGSMAVIAATNKGHFLNAPDIYMDKLVIGEKLAPGAISLDFTPAENLRRLAAAKKTKPSELTVIVLNRPRHQEIIDSLRQEGAKVKLIQDGDIAAAINVAMGNADMYIGSGGAPEGVLAAAALRVAGGQMLGRLVYKNDKERQRAKNVFGIKDLDKEYSLEELASGNSIMIATGVTDGDLLAGVAISGNHYQLSSIIFDAAEHRVERIATMVRK